MGVIPIKDIFNEHVLPKYPYKLFCMSVATMKQISDNETECTYDFDGVTIYYYKKIWFISPADNKQYFRYTTIVEVDGVIILDERNIEAIQD